MAKLSFHIFPKEPLDEAIPRWLGRFCAKIHETNPDFCDYFFIRSLDGGSHFRLRIEGELDFLNQTIAPPLIEIFEKEAQAQIAIEPYEPQIERFGGPKSYFFAENLFKSSSLLALHLLMQPKYGYEEKLGDALRAQVCFVAAAGFDRKKAAAFFKKMQKDWLVAFFTPEKPLEAHETAAYFSEIERVFETSFQKQEAKTRQLVETFWNAFSVNYQPSEPPDEWDLWMRANKLGLPSVVEKAWPDLIHLTNNRLGVTNQDEVFLAFILAKTLSRND